MRRSSRAGTGTTHVRISFRAQYHTDIILEQLCGESSTTCTAFLSPSTLVRCLLEIPPRRRPLREDHLYLFRLTAYNLHTLMLPRRLLFNHP